MYSPRQCIAIHATRSLNPGFGKADSHFEHSDRACRSFSCHLVARYACYLQFLLFTENRFTLLGPSTRYLPDMPEKRDLFSVTQTFFQAPRGHPARRALSVGPGLSHYANEAELIDHRLPPSPSPTHDQSPAHLYHSIDPPRGRERIRRRLSADELIFRREPLQEVRSPSPTPLDTQSLASSDGDVSVLPLHSITDGLHTDAAHTSSGSTLRQRTSGISPPSSPVDSPSFLRMLLTQILSAIISSYPALT